MEITFKDILDIIKKNVILLAVVSLVFAVASYGFTSLYIPKQYTSRVKLYVEASADASQTSNALNLSNYVKSVVPTYIEMLETTKFYTQVATDLGEGYTASEISRKVKFNLIEETEVFEAVIVDSTPTEAKKIADSVAKIAPETISEFKDNAYLKVVDDATLPRHHSSPNEKKNALIAFAVGLVLTLVFVFAKELLNTKIKYNPDINDILGIPVLSVIPYSDELDKNRKIYQ